MGFPPCCQMESIFFAPRRRLELFEQPIRLGAREGAITHGPEP